MPLPQEGDSVFGDIRTEEHAGVAVWNDEVVALCRQMCAFDTCDSVKRSRDDADINAMGRGERVHKTVFRVR